MLIHVVANTNHEWFLRNFEISGYNYLFTCRVFDKVSTALSFITLLIAEILSGKNARAWVSIDFK